MWVGDSAAWDLCFLLTYMIQETMDVSKHIRPSSEQSWL
jgi:hypothetical protein